MTIVMLLLTMVFAFLSGSAIEIGHESTPLCVFATLLFGLFGVISALDDRPGWGNRDKSWWRKLMEPVPVKTPPAEIVTLGKKGEWYRKKEDGKYYKDRGMKISKVIRLFEDSKSGDGTHKHMGWGPGGHGGSKLRGGEYEYFEPNGELTKAEGDQYFWSSSTVDNVITITNLLEENFDKITGDELKELEDTYQAYVKSRDKKKNDAKERSSKFSLDLFKKNSEDANWFEELVVRDMTETEVSNLDMFSEAKIPAETKVGPWVYDMNDDFMFSDSKRNYYEVQQSFPGGSSQTYYAQYGPKKYKLALCEYHEDTGNIMWWRIKIIRRDEDDKKSV